MPVVASGGPVASTTTTTEAPEPGMTPASAVSVVRFALPFLAGLALLAGLLALEITKRPRRALAGAGRATPVVVLVAAAGLLGAVVLAGTGAPALAQEGQADQAATIEAGDLGLQTLGGDDLDGGGSATEFNVDLSGPDERPGDSEHEDFRIMTFMVPATLAAEEIVWNGEGPTPAPSSPTTPSACPSSTSTPTRSPPG